MIAALQQEIEAEDMGISLTPEEQAELFGDWLPGDYAEEAERRWGCPDAFEQSQQRVAGYTKEDWIRIREEGRRRGVRARRERRPPRLTRPPITAGDRPAPLW